MPMTRQQLFVLIAALTCFLFLYFGFDTKTNQQTQIDQSRAMNASATDIRVLLKEAKSTLTPGQLASIQSFEQAIEASTTQEEKLKNLKLISGTWFEVQQPAIAGFYAEEIANLLQDETSWSIAGTTYAIGVQRLEAGKVKTFCRDKAVGAFEKAISINPDNVDHRINLAVTYADFPPEDQPMKGVLMLLDLNKKHPENVGVLTNLGRLGIQTGQFDKAIERLKKAVDLAPQNPKAYCLLAQAYQATGKTNEAAAARKQCESLANN